MLSRCEGPHVCGHFGVSRNLLALSSLLGAPHTLGVVGWALWTLVLGRGWWHSKEGIFEGKAGFGGRWEGTRGTSAQPSSISK